MTPLSYSKHVQKVLTLFIVVWLKFWTDANKDGENKWPGYYLGVYAALQVNGVVCFALLIW